MANEWEYVKKDLKTLNNAGQEEIVHNVQVKRNKTTGKIRVSPEEIEKAWQIQFAKAHKLEPRDLLLLLMVNAQPGPLQRGYICQKYKLNKMLFYQWKELEKIGLGNSIIHDDFKADVRGPVPINLWGDLERLSRNGILKVEGGNGRKKTVVVTLDIVGEQLAKEIWNNVSDPYLSITTNVKSRLFPLTPQTIKEQVHADYPEFKRSYTEPDKEQVMQF